MKAPATTPIIAAMATFVGDGFVMSAWSHHLAEMAHSV
jgi:hypothetical protein